MGCGYFLLAAADYITGRLERFLGVAAAAPGRPLLKRRVVEHCLYGVDLDPWAVQLAKASLWLDSAVPDERAGDRAHRGLSQFSRCDGPLSRNRRDGRENGTVPSRRASLLSFPAWINTCAAAMPWSAARWSSLAAGSTS